MLPLVHALQIIFVTSSPKDMPSALNAVLAAHALGACPRARASVPLPRSDLTDILDIYICLPACTVHLPCAVSCTPRVRKEPPHVQWSRPCLTALPASDDLLYPHPQALPTRSFSYGRRRTARCRHAMPLTLAVLGALAATRPSLAATMMQKPCAGGAGCTRGQMGYMAWGHIMLPSLASLHGPALLGLHSPGTGGPSAMAIAGAAESGRQAAPVGCGRAAHACRVGSGRAGVGAATGIAGREMRCRSHGNALRLRASLARLPLHPCPFCFIHCGVQGAGGAYASHAIQRAQLGCG